MIIFSPGPSNISERVRGALLAPDICHRDEEFTALLADVRRRILDVAGVAGAGSAAGGVGAASNAGAANNAPYESVVIGGSGSAAIESMVAAAKSVGRLLVASNGPYGERAAAMARYHGVDVHEWASPWGAELTPVRLDDEMARSGARAVHVVHHETATGRLNDLESLARVAKSRGALVLADTVSSIGGERLDVAGWQLDAVIGSANKCIRGVPGAAFVVASPAFVDAASAQRGAHYTNFATHLDAARRGETPFTPPVQVMYAFDAALQETLHEGVAARIAHYRALMAQLQDGLAQLGVRFVLERAAFGHTLVACHLPAGWSYERLHRALKRKGYVIYAAQGQLKATAFRLGIIGHFGASAVAGFLNALGEELRGQASPQAVHAPAGELRR